MRVFWWGAMLLSIYGNSHADTEVTAEKAADAAAGLAEKLNKWKDAIRVENGDAQSNDAELELRSAVANGGNVSVSVVVRWFDRNPSRHDREEFKKRLKRHELPLYCEAYREELKRWVSVKTSFYSPHGQHIGDVSVNEKICAEYRRAKPMK